AISEATIPVQFVFVGGGPARLSVGRVSRKHPHAINTSRNDARLRIDHFITQRWTHILQFTFRQNRDAVVRFFPMISRVITGGLSSERRKLIVRAFCLL